MVAPEDIEAARAAAAADSRNVPGLMQIADRLLHAGDPAQATELARAAMGYAPDDAGVWMSAAAILGVVGDVPAALEAAKRSVELAPDNEVAIEQYGALLLRAERPAVAVGVLARLVEMVPDVPRHWRALAEALHGAGMGARAITAMRRGIALAPLDVDYRLTLAAFLGALGRFGDALTELTAAESIAPADARIARMQSAFWGVLGEPGRALAAAEAAVARDPDHAEYRDHLIGLTGTIDRPGPHPDAPSAWAAPRFVAGIAPRPPRRTDFWAGLATQGRVISALLRREALTRYSHTRIGYLWAVLEPIAHLLTLGVLFRIFTQGPPPVGDSLFLFYLTGLIPFLVFWQVSQDMIASLPSATFLLQLPTVHPLDIALTRSILYFGTQLASAVVVFGIVGIMGLDVLPSNFLESAAALLTLWGMATGIGLINVVISVFVRSWETFFAAFNRLLYFASGIYYSPIRMPPEIRDILTLNPILQGIEWFRIGFYDRYDPPWVDRVYLVVCALSTLLLGLALFRYFRARLAVQT